MAVQAVKIAARRRTETYLLTSLLTFCLIITPHKPTLSDMNPVTKMESCVNGVVSSHLFIFIVRVKTDKTVHITIRKRKKLGKKRNKYKSHYGEI